MIPITTYYQEVGIYMDCKIIIKMNIKHNIELPIIVGKTYKYCNGKSKGNCVILEKIKRNYSFLPSYYLVKDILTGIELIIPFSKILQDI